MTGVIQGENKGMKKKKKKNSASKERLNKGGRGREERENPFFFSPF
jgi:hypothetical protein